MPLVERVGLPLQDTIPDELGNLVSRDAEVDSRLSHGHVLILHPLLLSKTRPMHIPSRPVYLTAYRSVKVRAYWYLTHACRCTIMTVHQCILMRSGGTTWRR